ncbi:MAG TPA: CAP domain-containing protein, partial [Pyrinomonadaceae bacterium]|nr:CAP domain-containing protein [Pyrinomonadaceae bacterium]
LSIVVLCLIALGAVRSATAQAPCSGKDALTAKRCAGDDNSIDEQALYDLVIKYRAANGLPSVRLSPALSMVANRHIIDLVQNVKSFTHGWSNCPYDINDEKTWPCVSDSPKRLNSGYPGQAFETLFRTATGKATPAQALDTWKKSKLHNSIILNLDTFKNLPWDEVGVAMDNGYAVLWFGSPGYKSSSTAGQGNGLGVGYEKALAGLNKLMSMQVTSAAGTTRWVGLSANKKVKLEILGSPQTIAQATVSINTGSNAKFSPDDQKIIVTMLGNLFPEWPNIDTWVTTSAAAILDDNSVWRTRTVRGIKVDLRSDGAGSLRLLVKP